MSALTDQMAVDLASVFTYDMPTTATIGVTSYTVLLDDLLSTEVDAFGGPELDSVRHVHFQTSALASIANGSMMTLTEAGTPRQKIVVSSVTSADGNELIVTVRGA